MGRHNIEKLDQCIEGSDQHGVCIPSYLDETKELLDLNQYLEFLDDIDGYNTLDENYTGDKSIDIVNSTDLTEEE